MFRSDDKCLDDLMSDGFCVSDFHFLFFSMEAIVQVSDGDRKLFVDLSSPTCLSTLFPRGHHKSSAYCVKLGLYVMSRSEKSKTKLG